MRGLPGKRRKLALLAGFADHGKRALGFLGRDFVKREADMHEHKIARRHIVEKRDRNLLLHGAERDDCGFRCGIDRDDLGRNGKAHGETSLTGGWQKVR